MIGTLTDPFDALFALQRELERQLASDWLRDSTAGMGAFPAVNIFQQGYDFVVIVELPGVEKEDLLVEAKDGTVRLSGTKSVNYGDKISMHRRERLAGSFDRTITFPVQIDPAGIKAEYRNGILALFVPRAEADKPRAIKIN